MVAGTDFTWVAGGEVRRVRSAGAALGCGCFVVVVAAFCCN